MPFSGYADLHEISVTGKPGDAGSSRRSRQSFRERLSRTLGDRMTVTDAAFDALLARPTRAFMDAPRAAGRYPLILYTAMVPTSQSVLGEFLASHGYVVAGIQRMGNMSVEFLEFRPNPTSLETNVSDIQFLYGHFRNDPGVDVHRLGLLGYSSATLANILFQMRNMPSSVLVNFEGWEGFKRGSEMLGEARDHDPVRVRVPYLRIGKADEESSPRYATTFDFFDAIKYSDRYDIRFENARHSSFTSLELLTGTWGEEERAIHAEALRKTRQFLDAYLLDDAKARNALQAEQGEGAAGRGYSLAFRKALPAAPSEEEFCRILEEDGGVRSAREVYSEIRKREPEHTIFREAVLSRLARSRRLPGDRLEIYRMIADAYPESFQAAYNLASACRETGRRDDAVRHLRNTLRLLAADETVAPDARQRFEATIREELADLQSEASPAARP